MTEEAARFGYERVIAGILQTIRRQELGAGAKLPTLPELQDQYDVSSTTARRAVDELKRRGAVESRQGSGLFVADPAKAAQVQDEKDDELRASVAALREEVREVRREMADFRELVARQLPQLAIDEPQPSRPSTPQPQQ